MGNYASIELWQFHACHVGYIGGIVMPSLAVDNFALQPSWSKVHY